MQEYTLYLDGKLQGVLSVLARYQHPNDPNDAVWHVAIEPVEAVAREATLSSAIRSTLPHVEDVCFNDATEVEAFVRVLAEPPPEDVIKRLTDRLADRFAGERLPFPFFGVPAKHKLNYQKLRRVAQRMWQLRDAAIISDEDCWPSPIRTVALDLLHKHCVETKTDILKRYAKKQGLNFIDYKLKPEP